MKPTPTFAIVAVLTLAGCSLAPLYREAGDMDPGNFGNATMMNTMAATQQAQAGTGPGKYDPSRAGMWLYGQYAATVMDNYRDSAARGQPVSSALTQTLSNGTQN